MRTRLASLLLLGLVACSDDVQGQDGDVDAPTDAPVDAVDAMGCGADFFLTGEYVDWDSTTTNFDGIEFVRWTVRGEPTRTVTTNPNGRVELCLNPGVTSIISITQSIPQPDYLPGVYVAEPTVFQPPGLFFFATKGIRAARAQTFYNSLGLTYDETRAHVLVQKQGPAIALNLNLGGTSFAVDNSDDLTWTAGNTGGLVLFANIEITATQATLSSPTAFVGPAMLPTEAGTLTITTIR